MDIRTGLCLTTVILGIAAEASQKPLHRELWGFRAPRENPIEHVKGFLWLETEGFADYGDWRLDTQFTHKMGSAYLIAPGVGKPIKDARTTIRIPRAGIWRVWVRTKDWLPEYSPGKFTVVLDGKAGEPLGVSKRRGWGWDRAGDWTLKAGDVAIALRDLSGAFARCDAILLTQDRAYDPVEDEDVVPYGLQDGMPTCSDSERSVQSVRGAERRRFRGEREDVGDGGTFDVVVVGAGPGGLGAAFAAARAGANVALVHDRPVLGGNSSCEMGIGTDGASGSHPLIKCNSRETGICEEANLMRGRTDTRTMSAAYQVMASRERNLHVFRNQRVQSVEKQDSSIRAVVARDTLTGLRTRYRGTIFVDATGDGWVGLFADASHMYGRESQDEYGEEPAPEKADDLTMSGCLMDRMVSYDYVMRDRPIPYETPVWARIMPKGFVRPWLKDVGPQWWIEHGGRFDDLRDPERARDELVRISFAYWGWVKNESHLKDKAANAEMTFIPYMNGRREGYRLKGDHVLTAVECLEGKIFPDRISYGGWPLDTHDPLGIENPTGNGYWERHPCTPEYSIPYRCLYSENIRNLMMAGRCVSVTHIALGSVRVEATLFTLGQAVGTAAASAVKLGLSPREYGNAHIRDLQQRLLKDDQYIPRLKNEDPSDFARTAAVSASSMVADLDAKPEYVIDGISRPVKSCYHGWQSDPAAPLPQWIRLDFGKPVKVREVRLTFDTDLTPRRVALYPKQLVKAYAIEGLVDGKWVSLAAESENRLRHRVQRFPEATLESLRVLVASTWGDPSARIFEIRAY